MEAQVLQPQKITRTGRFKDAQGRKIEDLAQYVTDWLDKNADYDISIHLGCDSHVGRETKYVTSVCLIREGKGGHIITKDDFAPRNMTIQERLMNEIVLSVNTAESLKHLGLEITIHVDYNPNPAFKSNELYATGIGTGAWFGYKTLGKPNAWAASKSADKTTRSSRFSRKEKKKYNKDRRKAAA
jgi:predicted RNase H-related nuclease YkuK (DUF458 family)